MKMHCLVFMKLAAIFFVDIFAFNVDLRYPLVYQTDQPGDYFGFSVALHPGSQSQDDPPWIMVGAPRGNHTKLKVYQPGRVMNCTLVFPRKPCTQMKLNKNEEIPGSMLGFSQDMLDGKYVTCAPRWYKKGNHRYEMFGKCYVYLKNTTFSKSSPNKIQPLNNKDKRYFSQKGENIPYFVYAQAGFSARFLTIPSQSQYEMVLGAPGTLNWYGTTILYSGSLEPIIAVNAEYLHHNTPYGLFGYAVSSGVYFKKNMTHHTASAPRANQKGHVLVYKFPSASHGNITKIKELIGSQIGEYFGSALASCDVNNDGLDDLFVGAPHFSISQDEGRVYLFMGNDLDKIGKIITGSSTENARFGATISCIGDLDHDGFEEVAIAAPYEGEGVVYIYSFAANSEWKLTQRILGSEVAPDMRGFGYSISRGQDVDGNGYNDFAVGAYLSGHAVLLRSRPVIKMSVNLLKVGELDRKVTEFNVTSCITYSGYRLPETLKIIQEVQVDLDLQRFYLASPHLNESKIILNSSKFEKCSVLHFKSQGKTYKEFTPIKIITAYKLIPEEDKMGLHFIRGNNTQQDKDLFCSTCPVLNNGDGAVVADTTISFAPECKNAICYSQISVTLQFLGSNNFVVGSASTLKLRVSVTNAKDADPAFSTTVELTLPVRIALCPPQCREQENKYLCSFGRLLGNNAVQHLDLDLDMLDVTATHNLSISATATTISQDQNISDNVANITFMLSTETDITVSGKTDNDLYLFDLRDNRKGEIKEKVTFNLQYQVETFGVSPVNEAVLYVEFPVAVSGKMFIELTNVKFALNSHPIVCESNLHTLENDTVNMSMVTEAKRHKRQIEEKIESTPQADGGMKSRDSMTDFPVNRTLFINCTSSHWQCSLVKCLAGPFLNRQAFAKLELSMALNASVLGPMLGLKDFIFYETRARVNIINPRGINQTGEKPDHLALGIPLRRRMRETTLETWILVASVIAGIWTLFMLISGFSKAGFFERTQKKAMLELKRETINFETLQALSYVDE